MYPDKRERYRGRRDSFPLMCLYAARLYGLSLGHLARGLPFRNHKRYSQAAQVGYLFECVGVEHRYLRQRTAVLTMPG